MELTFEQKRELYHNGYVVVKGVVSKELTTAAKRAIYKQMMHPRRKAPQGYRTALTSLVNKSKLAKLLLNTMGPFDAPTTGFAATKPPTEPSARIHACGIPAKDVPFYGFWAHIDGLWHKTVPASAEKAEDIQAFIGEDSASNIGDNGVPLFMDPQKRLSLGSFTAFVGVCLNDQSEEGRGNLGVLRGSHHEMERFFRWQREQGGVVGPSGPGWPRFSYAGREGGLFGFQGLPEGVTSKFATVRAGGLAFPKPDLVKMQEGDAVITLHSLCHDGTENYLGSEPRLTVYFRLRHQRPKGHKAPGHWDCPDRGPRGEFLDYPPDYDPYQLSIDCLCDIWREWDGMQDVVRAERAQARSKL